MHTHVRTHAHAHEHTRGVLVSAVVELSTQTWVGLRGPESGSLALFQGSRSPVPGPWHLQSTSSRLPSLPSLLGSGLSPAPAAPGQAGSVPLAMGVWSWWAALTSPRFSSALLRADGAEGACRVLSLWGASVSGGGLLIVLLSEVHRTETLTDQELGSIPWPLASLSQGDLFGNALGPDAAD